MVKKYNIVKQIGEGGFAKTFHAVHKHNSLNCCLKELPMNGISKTDFAQIQDEAKIMGRNAV
jgi:serine/threonine protein kinase